VLRLTPLCLQNDIGKSVDLLKHTTGEFHATKCLGSLLGSGDGFVELFRGENLDFGLEH
jgi:hypothetical protein